MNVTALQHPCPYRLTAVGAFFRLHLQEPGTGYADMSILHKDLVALKQRVIANDKKLIRCVGICHNINHRDAHKEPLKSLMARWPEGTGCPHFPVPYKSADYDYDDVQAYTYIEDLWVGEYGAARMRLLDFLIEETKP